MKAESHNEEGCREGQASWGGSNRADQGGKEAMGGQKKENEMDAWWTETEENRKKLHRGETTRPEEERQWTGPVKMERTREGAEKEMGRFDVPP